ncbi:MAG: dodecin domain-containing protein [Clostridia bacterium]|nr:dodecin domain-containing protein [Clostridia bacterium]
MEMQKHISITGSSSTSWKDAITSALEEASKSIDYLKSVDVIKQYATISGNKIESYLVDLDISFTIDSSRK